MAEATGSQSYLAYIPESSWGTTPTSTPVVQKIAQSSQSLQLDFNRIGRFLEFFAIVHTSREILSLET